MVDESYLIDINTKLNEIIRLLKKMTGILDDIYEEGQAD